MFDRTTFVAGVATGAVASSVALFFISWASKLADPPERHSLAYDRCLATGRNARACDAAMRVLAAEIEKARAESVESCLADAEARSPHNSFNDIMCGAEAEPTHASKSSHNPNDPFDFLGNTGDRVEPSAQGRPAKKKFKVYDPDEVGDLGRSQGPVLNR